MVRWLRPPSRNPRCPPAVTEAYEIHQLIGDEVNVGNCNEQYDVVNNVFGENNDGTNQVQYSNDEEEFDEDRNPTTVVITTTPPPSRTGLLHGASTGGSSGNKNVFLLLTNKWKWKQNSDPLTGKNARNSEKKTVVVVKREREDDNRRHRQLMELMANAVRGIITSALKK